MAVSKDLVGKKLNPYTFTVERGKVKEFCRAIGETNPVFLDQAKAREAGFEDTPIPPTFQTAFQFWGYPEIFDDMGKMGIDVQRLLHMKEEYSYLKPIYPGTEIHAQGEIIDVKTGKMDMVTFKTTYANKSGEALLEAEMAIVIRPEDS